MGRKGCLDWMPPPCCSVCTLQMSPHVRTDPSLWAAGFRKLLVSSAHSHMGWSQNHLFFAWRLLSSHRRPSLAFFHCERGMGTGPTFLSSLLPKLQQGRQQVSSWHLIACLEETPVSNLTIAGAMSACGVPRGPTCQQGYIAFTV